MAAQQRYAHLQRGLLDVRSHEVVFLAHCLLNQNTRYLGGAVCPGAVRPAIREYVDRGVGIVQMPCPEQRVWGGVLKTRMLWVLEHRWAARGGPLLAGVAETYLRHRYARLARAVVSQVEDYVTSGFTVTDVVGVAGSPSCGVDETLDLRAALAGIARCPRAAPTSRWMNDVVIDPALRPGSGLFTRALRDELARRDLHVPFAEHTLGNGSCKTASHDARPDALSRTRLPKPSGTRRFLSGRRRRRDHVRRG